MPRRGEKIGDAYVAIHGDGRGIRGDIRKDLQDLNKTLEKDGRQQGETFGDGFADGFEHGFGKKAFRDALDNAFGRDQGRIRKIALVADDLSEAFADRFGDRLGPRMANIVLTEVRDGVRRIGPEMFQDLSRIIQRASDDIAREAAEIGKSWEDMLDEAYRDNAEFDQKVREDRDRTFDLEVAQANRQRALYQQISDFRNRLWQQRIKEDQEARKSLDELQASLERLVQGHGKYGDSVDRIVHKTRELREQMHALGTETAETDRHFRLIRASTITLTPRINRLNRQWRDLSDNMGRLSGRGSRNNFLNFVGSVNRNFSNLVGTIVLGTGRMAAGFVNFVRSIPEFFTDPKLFGQVLVNFTTGVVTLVPTLIALGVTFVTLATFAGVLTSALTGLLGILTALISTVAFAAFTALPALAGVLLPLGATIGVIAAGFLALDDAQKKALKNDLKPLTNSFKELGDSVADILFQDVAKWARDLKPVVDSLKPGVEGVARAIRDTLGDAIQAAAENPQFEHFVDRFNRFLPNAVRKLGDVITNVFEGLGGFLLAMLPSINDFLRWLRDITDEFSNWANSAKGRREIREFFEKAADSAESLGDFLGQVIELVADLLDKSRSTGDTIFDKMADAVEDMVGWLDSKEGKDAMEEWLTFAEDLSEDLGELIEDIKDLWDELDSPQNRQFLSFILDTFGALIQLVIDTNREVNELGEKFGKVANKIDGAFAAFRGFSFGDIFSEPLEAVERLMTFLRRVSRALTGLPVVGNLFRPLADGIRRVDELIDKVADGIRSLPTPRDVFATVFRTARQFETFVKSTIRNTIMRLPDVDDLFAKVRIAAASFIGLISRIPQMIRDIPVVGSIFSAAISAAQTLVNLIQTIADKLSHPFTLNFSINRSGGGLPDIPFIPDPSDVFGRTAPSLSGSTSGPTIAPTINVFPQTTDARAVAQETLNRIVALSY